MPETAAPPRSKSTAIAVLLWLFLGALGVHRLYLGGRSNRWYGLAMLFVNLTLLVLWPILLFTWPFVLAWWVLEGILLPWTVRSARRQREAEQGVPPGEPAADER